MLSLWSGQCCSDELSGDTMGMIGLAYPQDYLDACFTCELATANTLSPEAA